jgi:hypothetical protein
VKVAVFTSVSANIAGIAALTVPNKFWYCLRHDYSLVVDNRPYAEAVRDVRRVIGPMLDVYDLVWTLDCDAVITDMTSPIHTLPCLGPGVTVCEEGIVDWNRLNCGSMVWRSGSLSRYLLDRIDESVAEWGTAPCVWQTWLGSNAESLGDAMTVAPLRSFNSCAWTHPGGSVGEAGSHWERGDLVFHPCGVFPYSDRVDAIQSVLETGVIQ